MDVYKEPHDFSVAPLNQIFINFWRDESNEIRVWNR